jgi:hypothetical protein
MSWFSKKVKADLTAGLPVPLAAKVDEAVTLAETAVSAAVNDAVAVAETAVNEAVKTPSRAPHILCAPIAYLFCLPFRPFRNPLTSEIPHVVEPVQVPQPSTSTVPVEVVPESKVCVSGAEPVQEKTTQASSEALLNTRSQPVL